MLANTRLQSEQVLINTGNNNGLLKLKALVEENRLGMVSQTDEFQHSALSLSPWMMSAKQFQRAKNTASVVSDVFSQAGEDREFLIDSLADYQSSTGLLVQLKNIVANTQATIATNYNYSRQDFLLDVNHHWRLVESNSIAAGMGPFSETVIETQKQLLRNRFTNYAENQATYLQSQAMNKAATKLNNNDNPLIVFVVEKNEDNIHDQAMLARGIEKLGGRVLYKTLVELRQELSSHSDELSIMGVGSIDLIYFRTGYNLDDYNDETGQFEKLLQMRSWIEQHKVVVSPGINYQIATSKWLQMKLSELSIDELVQRFSLTQHQATIAAMALDSDFYIPHTRKEIQSKLATGLWILKSQNEGGGNVFDVNSVFEFSETSDMDYILMKKIDSVQRKDAIDVLSNNQLETQNQLISELGIFTLGREHQYGGYLLRSKPHNNLEAGVHRGGGLLDCVAIK